MLQIVFSFKTNHYKNNRRSENGNGQRQNGNKILKVTLYLSGHLYQHAAQIMSEIETNRL